MLYLKITSKQQPIKEIWLIHNAEHASAIQVKEVKNDFPKLPMLKQNGH
jgi:hypothetical protein